MASKGTATTNQGLAPKTNADTMCGTCGLPQLLCVCRSLDAETTVLRIRIETRRYGKAVTVVGPFATAEDADRFASVLKRGLATGGTHKGLEVELQGDLLKRARSFLEKEGFAVET